VSGCLSDLLGITSAEVFERIDVLATTLIVGNPRFLIVPSSFAILVLEGLPTSGRSVDSQKVGSECLLPMPLALGLEAFHPLNGLQWKVIEIVVSQVDRIDVAGLGCPEAGAYPVRIEFRLASARASRASRSSAGSSAGTSSGRSVLLSLSDSGSGAAGDWPFVGVSR
jgi:hypothetical protein